jgi:hypothetical protein
MHATGSFDYDFVVGYGHMDADKHAYVATRKGSIFGTFTPGSSDDDWDEPTHHEIVRANWRAICATPAMNINVHIAADFGGFIGSLFAYATVIGVVVLSGLAAGGKMGQDGRTWEWDH